MGFQPENPDESKPPEGEGDQAEKKRESVDNKADAGEEPSQETQDTKAEKDQKSDKTEDQDKADNSKGNETEKETVKSPTTPLEGFVKASS